MLVVELLGRPNGVGFEIGSAFQLFDVATLLAYALPFTVIMLVVESLVVQPFERHVSRWRTRPLAVSVVRKSARAAQGESVESSPISRFRCVRARRRR